MKETIAERKAQAAGVDGETQVLEKIAEMPASDRAIAKRLHALIRKTVPELAPRTWYGMPAYAKDGKVLCYFQNAKKFKSRYSTFGFSDQANLDDGEFWPVAFALKKLTPAEEAKIVKLLKKAAR